MDDHTLVLIPGMGADERLYVYQRSLTPAPIILSWLDPLQDETLRDYAKRMADTITPCNNLIIGGVSMGGMLAQEIAAILKLRGVIIIAACCHPAEIAPSVRAIASIGRHTPIFFGNRMQKLAQLGMSRLGVFEPTHKEIILEIAQDVSFAFARWATGAILDWPGAQALPCPSLRIHGRRDRIICCPQELPDTAQEFVLIDGAGHIPNLTHAPQVNRAIASWIEKLPSD